MKDKSMFVDVVVTSPPYNIGVEYNSYTDKMEPKSYSAWLYVVAKTIYRILKDDGSFFLNMGSTCKNPSFAMEMCRIVRNAGWVLQNNIIWVKSISVGGTSHGHFKPIKSKRFLNDQHENIFHFTKDGNVSIERLAIGVPYADKSNIGRYSDQDLRCGGNTWFIPYETVQKKKQHPAGFPVGLPEKCIKMHGIRDDMIVLDPFLGAGTTLIACQKLGVSGIGVELDDLYCQVSLDLLKGLNGTA